MEKPKNPEDHQKIIKNQDEDTESSSETVEEYHGPKGPEPTRYGDWEKNGRCVDF